MLTRVRHLGLLTLWLLAGHASSETTPVPSPTPTTPMLVTTSQFVSPSLNQKSGGLSEGAKTGISVGVTLASILLFGSLTICCVIRRRNKALTRPQRRVPDATGDSGETVVDDGLGKGKEEGYYMSSTSPHAHGAVDAQHGVFQQAPNGVAYHGDGGYSTIARPDPTYAQQQQVHAISYPTTQPGEAYGYPGTGYHGVNLSQQAGYAGPSYSQYQPEAQSHPQQQQLLQQQQQRGDISWVYPISATSVASPAHGQEYQHQYHTPDVIPHQDQPQSLDQSQDQDEDMTLYQHEYYGPEHTPAQQDTYHIPPPRPDVSELPDQRKPIEMMGEGHYKEAP
ncbi:hypothetical protein F5Y19DRAFT_158025 [Xylariaceae sp. FL1651]|nr:hypothetical protein F5Y19DRAFT_158025 [Xylariaceae sp. FL1651]